MVHRDRRLVLPGAAPVCRGHEGGRSAERRPLPGGVRAVSPALQKAMDRAITLAPVIQVRNGTYRSYIPPISILRGPSIGQVGQIAMTDEDWPLQGLDAADSAADDIRVDGHLDVSEDVLALNPIQVHGGNRYQSADQKAKGKGPLFRGRLVLGRVSLRSWATVPWQRLSAPRRGFELPAAMGEQLRGIRRAHPGILFLEHLHEPVATDSSICSSRRTST